MAAETEIERLLRDFVRAKSADPAAEVNAISPLPGHAGQSYSFELEYAADAGRVREKLVLRLAPAGVRAVGTADIARQARIMASLAETSVPVPPIKWFGDEPDWFDRPYFVAAFVTGDKLALGEHEFPPAQQRDLARLTIQMMAALHDVPWEPRRTAWGEPCTLADEMTRLDALLDRPTLEPSIIAAAPRLRARLKSTLPDNPLVGCVHGDLNWSNCLYENGRLRAVIDWELAQIGAVLIDLGWLCLFSDRETWVKQDLVPRHILPPDELAEVYRAAVAMPITAAEVRWFRAFACYRFGVITAFNVMLHRRGKRHDPTWEDIALTGPRFFERGLELLG
ncbi:MAG TPA: phosphotransferase family protein [Candidatus Binataceae bacterium]|nr:phosphotransferase family protein [Candidatus Binataceae bacterium]